MDREHSVIREWIVLLIRKYGAPATRGVDGVSQEFIVLDRVYDAI